MSLQAAIWQSAIEQFFSGRNSCIEIKVQESRRQPAAHPRHLVIQQISWWLQNSQGKSCKYRYSMIAKWLRESSWVRVLDHHQGVSLIVFVTEVGSRGCQLDVRLDC
jgi:hypothetical protein